MLVGAPIALRFPRGGVGLVIGVSLVVFALYYVGLIAGESLANKGIMPPFWAMWGGERHLHRRRRRAARCAWAREGVPARGGDWGDRWTRCATWLQRPAARLALARGGRMMRIVRPLDRYVFAES